MICYELRNRSSTYFSNFNSCCRTFSSGFIIGSWRKSLILKFLIKKSRTKKNFFVLDFLIKNKIIFQIYTEHCMQCTLASSYACTHTCVLCRVHMCLDVLQNALFLSLFYKDKAWFLFTFTFFIFLCISQKIKNNQKIQFKY